MKIRKVAILALFIFSLSGLTNSGFAIDQNFPVNPGEQKRVTTLRWPQEQYDIYLPSTYSSTSNPLPLFFTLSPGGGGLVSQFKNVAEEKQVIVVGLLDSKNGRAYKYIYPNIYAVLRDLMERVNYDPTAVYAAGFSGGGWGSYDLTKYYRPHLTGVFSMGGWLGNQYDPHDRFRSGLLVARSAGTNDAGARYVADRDYRYLTPFGVIVSDYEFSGGHQVAPDSVKRLVIDWLVSNRQMPTDSAQVDAENAAASWRQRIINHEDEAVFLECVAVLLNQQQSFIAKEAQRIVWDLMDNYERFSTYDLTDKFSGEFANDFFWGMAFGPGHLGDLDVFYSCSMAAEKVTDTLGSFVSDPQTMLSDIGLPPPRARYNTTPQNPDPLQTVIFNGTSSIAPWSSIDLYSWDFGDTNVADGIQVTHSYQADGNYAVTLTITTTLGQQHSSTQDIIVGVPPVIESVVATANSLMIAEELQLACQATHPRGDSLSFQWKIISGPGELYSSSLEVDASKISARFSRPGTYLLTVAVSNGPIEVQETIEIEVTPDSNDNDNDGLTNTEEDYNHNGIVDAGESDKSHPDSDKDGLWDYEEILWETNPLVKNPVFLLRRDGFGSRVWSSQFENGEGYVEGPVDGQFAWRDTSGLTTVSPLSGKETSYGLVLPGDSGGSEIEAFWGVQRAKNVTITFDAQLTPGSLPRIVGAQKSAALFMVNLDGFVCGYDGELARWVISTTQATANTWYNYEAILDYDSKTWDLKVDGVITLAGLGFNDPTLERFSRMHINQFENEDAASTKLDNMSVKVDSPFDIWLNTHFTDNTDALAQPLADADGDGASNLFEFSQGGNPWVSDPHQWAPKIGNKGNEKQLQFRKNGSELDYIIETTHDLMATEWTAYTGELIADAEGNYALPLTSPDDRPKFYRIKVLDYSENL